MSDFLRKCRNFTKDVQIKAPVVAPLALACQGSLDIHASPILAIALVLISLLHSWLFLFPFVLQVRMEFMQPLSVNVKQQN